MRRGRENQKPVNSWWVALLNRQLYAKSSSLQDKTRLEILSRLYLIFVLSESRYRNGIPRFNFIINGKNSVNMILGNINIFWKNYLDNPLFKTDVKMLWLLLMNCELFDYELWTLLRVQVYFDLDPDPKSGLEKRDPSHFSLIRILDLLLGKNGSFTLKRIRM